MTILHDKPNIKHEEQTKNSGGEVTNNKHSIGCSSDAQDMVENELQVEAPDERDCIFSYLNLTTHNSSFLADPVNLDWCQERPEKRGPVVATTRHPMKRNAIGAHSGSYCIYRALAIACGELDAMHVPELSLTSPVMCIGPFPSWSDPSKIATIDPWGHVTTEVFSAYLKKGYDIRPTIAITRAHIDLLEIHKAVRAKRLVPDGKVLNSAGQAIISKAAVEPVWYLPELANRFGVSEMKLRETLFMETNLMYPELITRPDLKVFLPPIGGLTIYMFGDPATISDENIEITVRVHDEVTLNILANALVLVERTKASVSNWTTPTTNNSHLTFLLSLSAVWIVNSPLYLPDILMWNIAPEYDYHLHLTLTLTHEIVQRI